MDNWSRICGLLSEMFDSNADLNFNIRLTPEQVADYIINKILFMRTNSIEPDELEAALFVTVDGECGFIAGQTWTTGTYKYLINEFNSFVVDLPEELRHKLWCRVQHNNDAVNKLVKRLGFKEAQRTDAAIYYLYGGKT